jgi:Uma2 family endonuclease
MATAAVETDSLESRQSLVLKGLNWAKYRQISDTLTGSHVRLTYDQGVLELMTKSTLHEILSRLYFSFLAVLAEEFACPLASCGSMTCDREDLDRGAEPDECFYLVNEPRVRGKDQIDLAIDPPPDLMMEIDLSRSSRRRLEIYAAIKVPEVWVIGVDSLTVLHLGSDCKYAEAQQSQFFPGIPMSELAGLALRRGEMDNIALMREFRAWVGDCLVRGTKGQK